MGLGSMGSKMLYRNVQISKYPISNPLHPIVLVPLLLLPAGPFSSSVNKPLGTFTQIYKEKHR